MAISTIAALLCPSATIAINSRVVESGIAKTCRMQSLGKETMRESGR
jgi:hypothetical protein